MSQTGTSTQRESAALRNEHASLEREVAEWREWWTQLKEIGDPHFGEMGDRLARFRDHLSAHFQHEETQECLPLVLAVSPLTAQQIARLRDEHQQLLDDLDRLIERLHACDLERDCWGQARQDFETFLDRLNTHEAAEDRLLDRVS